MQRKIWLVVAWHARLRRNQPSFVVIAPCDKTIKGTHIAVILAIHSACCCHPCDQQLIYDLIVASLRLAMVDLLLSHARLQYDHFSQHQNNIIDITSLTIQQKDMLIVVASCDQQQ
jgi:hypothetical protein